MPFDGTTLSPEAETLVRAKQYILDHGWCPNRASDEAGRVCVVVAVRRTLGDWQVVGRYLSTAIGRYGTGAGVVGFWNDTPGRTLDEVLSAFDRAIALAINDR